VEERNEKWNTPYLFNGKELDEETGLYYYGARYYSSKESVWLSVDKPLIDGTYLNGKHNGGVYNSFNLNGYIYCYQNPVVLVDPDGNQAHFSKRPTFTYDSGFSKFPKQAPTAQDRKNFGLWVAKATVARFVMPDAANAYLHYMENTGKHYTFNFAKYLNNDPSGQKLLDKIKPIAKINAEKVLTKEGSTSYYSQGFEAGFDKDFPYPKTENWQKAIGAFNVYYKADLSAKGNEDGSLTYTLNMTLYAEDKYNFNPGQADIATGTPDSENGRFEIIGWAKEFMQSGSAKLTKPIIWTTQPEKK
jgi:RHS repeat-associated protein